MMLSKTIISHFSLKDPCASLLYGKLALCSGHSCLGGAELAEPERGHNKMCVPD